MMVYRLKADRANTLNFYISPDEIEATLGDYFILDEPNWAEFWKPLAVSFQDDSDKGNVIAPPDITVWYTSNNLALNQKAYDALGSALEPYGELLPITCEGVPYWLLHTTLMTEMDAVDLKNSERSIDEGGFIDLKKLTFKLDAVQNLLVFQTPYSGGRNLYCTDTFKKLVDDAGLNGLVFSADLVSII